MNARWFARVAEVAVVAVTVAAICQELEKPREERRWYGKVGFVPYDFRFPTVERFKERYWNPDNNHIVTPEVFGVGWAINLHALMENLRRIGQGNTFSSEEDFLMPTKAMKDLLSQSAEAND